MMDTDNFEDSEESDALPPENVFGHTKKIRLIREAIERRRRVDGKLQLKILDIGCGNGRAVTRFLGRRGDTIVGIDMHSPSVEYASASFKRPGLRFMCMDAESLSSDGERFDVVILADVLEHLDSPSVVLDVAGRLLEPGGVLIATVPNGYGPFEVESAISRLPIIGSALLWVTDRLVALANKTLMKDVWSRAAANAPAEVPYNAESGHVQFFSQRSIKRLLHNCEFETVFEANLSFLSGPFTNYFFSPFSKFCHANVWIADKLPLCVVSAWYFECRRITAPK
jgi:2-polyprenyl-3-methyl-5-hydroxy-6-metoxy-1,4-benzoquinol methylase